MISKYDIAKLSHAALKEDIGKGDITTRLLIPPTQISEAIIFTKEAAIISGLNIAKKVFHQVDKKVLFKALVRDGQRVKANTKIIHLKGKTQSLLTAERVALNFLSHMSAIATKTSEFVWRVAPYKVKIMDTRKTTPGLRLLEREAVRQGEGVNHRLTLTEFILIKDNHREACRRRLSIKEMIRLARRKGQKPIEIEVNNLQDFKEALKAKPNFILLDNMSLGQIRKAVALRKKMSETRIELEASGNISINNVRSIAKTGVERISIGALTHTKKAIDLSMELLP